MSAIWKGVVEWKKKEERRRKKKKFLKEEENIEKKGEEGKGGRERKRGLSKSHGIQLFEEKKKTEGTNLNGVFKDKVLGGLRWQPENRPCDKIKS